VVAIVFFVAFIRAVKTGQYDDDYTPSVRMLFDDELKINDSKSVQTTEEKQI
jgi:cbb3-type cytochrome oxidase maturation protein